MANDELQKWMIASIKATELKFALEDILTNSFSPEEMESVKYKQLLDTVDQYLEHIMGKYRQEKNKKLLVKYEEDISKLKKEIEKLRKELGKKKRGFLNWQSATIATVGGVIIEVIRLLILWLGG